MKIIVIGSGRVGSGLAKNLCMSGINVSVIDCNEEAFEALGPGFTGKTYHGTAFDQKVLAMAGIERVDALAAVTGKDDVNLVLARMAKSFYKVPTVAARVYDPRKAKIYRRLGIQTISPVTLGIQRFTSTLVNSHLNVERLIGAGQVGMVDMEVGARLNQRGPKDVDLPGQIQVVALTRNGKTSLVNPAITFREGDLLHVFVHEGARDMLSDLQRK